MTSRRNCAERTKHVLWPDNKFGCRSIGKAITWRVLATATTIIIALIVSGSAESALTIGSFDFAVKLVVYYMHELGWYHCSKRNPSAAPVAPQVADTATAAPPRFGTLAPVISF